ncbi:hypothetical protein [Pseudoalteromonas denitrificans]|uniref:Major tropism determinant N-terminal domain-containing protein n=1 Tax=Pseudoalteromonas denitrificans DSM 6059 TaxID=1123010 RepID=A0A1I1Q4R5_9GAMM|nr:hypothetical protein [Pseudoalteromonas denitrificans]SFD16987.1 hypothetical protein SAMN02745724_03736 [Pseudoalteromonas denitrificans DSM 6059]
MSNQIQIRRGVESNRGGVTPAAGEPIWITDNKRLFIGDGITPGGIDIFSQLGSAIYKNAGSNANQVLLLDSSGKIPSAVLPSLAIGEPFEVASQSAMLALNAQAGDLAIRSDESKSYILKSTPANVLANWVLLRTPTDSVLSVNGKTGSVTLTKSHVGLANVTNESKTQMFHSPTFTGSPKTPTANISDNSANIASTAWVKTWVDSLGLAVEGGSIDGGTF